MRSKAGKRRKKQQQFLGISTRIEETFAIVVVGQPASV